MQILDPHRAYAMLGKKLGKWILVIDFYVRSHILDAVNNPYDEIKKAAPYLNDPASGQLMVDEHGIIICNSEDECEQLFWQTVGDDGPTKLNPYDGPARVYALTISPDGEFMDENT